MPDFTMPEYHVGLHRDIRTTDGGEVVGMAWSVIRRLPDPEGQPRYETLVVSKDVFEHEDDAKRDAVRVLKTFGCCDDSPFRKALRTIVEWMTDEA